MKKAVERALLVIVLGGGSLLTMAWAQQPGAPTKPPAAGPDAAPDPPRPARRPSPPAGGPNWSGRHFGGAGGIGGFGGRMRGMFHSPMSEEEMQEADALHQAIDKLKSAKTDAEKTSATKEISQLLEKSFQHDMERRETQISEIEGRVKKLREQIDKRKKAKDEIISLHLKTIMNEADGLGFPGRFDNESDIGPQGRSFQWDAMPEQAVPMLPPRTPRSE